MCEVSHTGAYRQSVHFLLLRQANVKNCFRMALFVSDETATVYSVLMHLNSVGSTLSFGISLWLILQKSPQVMRSYKWFLLHVAVSHVCFNNSWPIRIDLLVRIRFVRHNLLRPHDDVPDCGHLRSWVHGEPRRILGNGGCLGMFLRRSSCYVYRRFRQFTIFCSEFAVCPC